MLKILNKTITKSVGVVLAGIMTIAAVPMNAEASGALGISTQVGISGELAQAESSEAVESAVNQAVLNAFHLDGYSNLGIVNVNEGKVNIRESASTDGKIVGKIGNNAGCDILDEDGEWIHVKYGKVEG